MEMSEDEWFTKISVSQRETHIKHVLSVSLKSKVIAPRVSSLSTKVPACGIDQSKPMCS